MDEIELHETYIEVLVVPADHPDAEAYLWVCGCGEGADDLSRFEARLQARRHERLAG